MPYLLSLLNRLRDAPARGAVAVAALRPASPGGARPPSAPAPLAPTPMFDGLDPFLFMTREGL